MFTTPRLRAATVVVAAAAMMAAMVACSDQGNGKPGAQGGGTLTIAQSATPTFVRNYNVVSPTSTRGPLWEMVYEPLLAWTAGPKGVQLVPWLATKYEFGDSGRSVTFTLRDGVTWSDGDKFSADDVVYTYQLPLKNKALNTGQNYTSVTKVDDRTVKFGFGEPAYTSLQLFLAPVVPEHLWSKQGAGVAQWTNENPVGTGPVKLDRFTAQQASFSVRDDYWNGKPAMKTVKVVAGSEDSIHNGLSNGTIDWAAVGWPNGQRLFAQADPEHHKFWFVPGGGTQNLIFNTEQQPFDDVHVRKAMSLALDRAKISAVGGTNEPPASATGIDQSFQGDVVKKDYSSPPAQDAGAAKAELARSGYTVQDGQLAKGGKRFRPTLTIIGATPGWNGYAAAIVDQVKQVLGIGVQVQSRESNAFNKNLELGQFGMALRGLGGLFLYVPYNVTLNSSFYAPTGKSSTSNFVRWRDKTTDDLLARLAGTDPTSPQARELGYQLQDRVIDQVPMTGLVRAVQPVQINTKNWTGWPASPEQATMLPTPTGGPQAIVTMLGLKKAGG